MLKQRFLLYRDLLEKEPHFRQMAPVSLCLHIALALCVLGISYWLNGMTWSLGGGGGGGGNPEITLIAESVGGSTPPPVTMAPPKPPEPKPEPKPEPEPPKPKPEPEKPKKVEQPKPSVDPEAVQLPSTPEKKKEPKKEEPEKKPEPPKPPKPKEPPKPVPPKKEEPKPQPDKKKEVPKTASKPAVTTPKPNTTLAMNEGKKPGPTPLAGGGPSGEGAGAPGPAGTSNLPSELQGWGTNLYNKIHPLWNLNQPGGLRRDPENYAEIQFTVDNQGNILGEPKITKQAVDPEVAELGLKSLKMAGRLPSFPTSFLGTSITVCYRFVPPQ